MQVRKEVRLGRFAPFFLGAFLLLCSVDLWLPPGWQLSYAVHATDWLSLLLPPAASSELTPLTQKKIVSTTCPVLVLLPQTSAPAELARLQLTYRVSSLLQPRIAVLEVNEAELAVLVHQQGLDGVYSDTIPPAVLSRLSPEERLFVEAWNLQRAIRQKQRVGEGLPWDAPGFQAPGPPSGAQP